MHETKEVEANGNGSYSLAFLDLQPQLAKFLVQDATPLPQLSFVSGHHYDVITVPIIVPDSLHLLHVVVYW